MNVILCSGDTSLLQRWQQILRDKYHVALISTVTELKRRVQHDDADLYILHRTLIDLRLVATMKDRSFIVLADIPDDYEAVDVLRLGALAYASAYISPPRLLESVQVASSGRVWIGKHLLQKIIRGTGAGKEEKDKKAQSVAMLSSRESEVAELVSEGRSNLQIAEVLGISERTVKAHIGAIFKKTETSSRLQLALFMKNLG